MMQATHLRDDHTEHEMMIDPVMGPNAPLSMPVQDLSPIRFGVPELLGVLSRLVPGVNRQKDPA